MLKRQEMLEQSPRRNSPGSSTPTKAETLRHGIPRWGASFIHGAAAGEDWTFGFVAVNNTALEELFDTVPLGTSVKIVP
jgi:hypothetical protein